MIDAKALTDGRVEQGAQEPQGEGDRAGPLHGDSRAARQRALPLADDSASSIRTAADSAAAVVAVAAARVLRLAAASGGAAAGAPVAAAAVAVVAAAVVAAVSVANGGPGSVAAYMAGKKAGDKMFSDLFTLKSDVGNPILRQTPIAQRQQAGEAGDVGREGHSAQAFGPNQPREHST